MPGVRSRTRLDLFSYAIACVHFLRRQKNRCHFTVENFASSSSTSNHRSHDAILAVQSSDQDSDAGSQPAQYRWNVNSVAMVQIQTGHVIIQDLNQAVAPQTANKRGKVAAKASKKIQRNKNKAFAATFRLLVGCLGWHPFFDGRSLPLRRGEVELVLDLPEVGEARRSDWVALREQQDQELMRN